MTKVLNIKDGMSVWEVTRKLEEMNVQDNERIAVKSKVGKRKKFKSFRVSWGYRHCENCGHYTVLEFKKGDPLHSLRFDSHFGPSWIAPEMRA